MRSPRLTPFALSFVAAALVACKPATPPAAPAPAPAPAPAASGKDHDHDHAASGKPDHHEEGAAADLGTVTIAGFSVKASQDGTVEAGKEAHFDLQVTGGSGTVSTVRVWIGAEDGKGSRKARGEGDPKDMHLHVDAPSPLDPAARLWIELELEGGTKAVGSLPLHR
jgi:hypothetical protein